MLGVGFDGFQDQIEFIGTVDFAGHRVKAVGLQAKRFREVIQSIGPMSGMVTHDENRTLCGNLTVKESEMIGTKVEHGD